MCKNIFARSRAMGIPYEGSILLDIYFTKGPNWMHGSRRLSASSLTNECNEHLTILNLNIAFTLLHGITKKKKLLKKDFFYHVIVGDNMIFLIILTIRVDNEIKRL